MDYVGHFEREVAAFEAAGRVAAGFDAAPAVPSCPGWVVTDLILHLGVVHRLVSHIIGERLQEPPESAHGAWLQIDQDWRDWLPPGHAPQSSPVPAGLLDWFHAGAGDLRDRFGADPGERVWTWSADHSVGFWQRMQAIEAAVHRWDAENSVGEARPLSAALAADAIGQTFEVMAPMRRAVGGAQAGRGERFLFRRTDGPGTWLVRFDGTDILLDKGASPDDGYDIRVSGTASDLALFLWQRTVPGHPGVPSDTSVRCELDVHGDVSLLARYFALVPPL